MKHPLTRVGKELLDADGKHIADCETEEIAEILLRKDKAIKVMREALERLTRDINYGAGEINWCEMDSQNNPIVPRPLEDLLKAKQALQQAKETQ